MAKELQLGRLMLGVCYYPEQWDESLWADDLRRMREHGIEVIRIAEFAWNKFEPSDGVFTFEFFDRFLALTEKMGMRVIFCTPTATPPAWLTHKHPEVLNAAIDGTLYRHGMRKHHNMTSPVYLGYVRRIVEHLARHYAHSPAIIGWQIDNEVNCETSQYYAASDHAAFRIYLKEKFGSLSNLNEKMGMVFWNQEYTSWEEIFLARPTLKNSPNPHLLLEEKRFISHISRRYIRLQAEILRRFIPPEQFITTNGMFRDIDNHALTGESLDFMVFDNYPNFSFGEGTDPKAAGAFNDRNASFNLARTRSVSPVFGIMEQQSGAGGWNTRMKQPMPKPGQMRLWTLQAVAHGADFVSFFRWRTAPYGTEIYWHGLNDYSNQPNRRLFELKRIAADFAALEDVTGSHYAARAGILCDYDNEWDAETDVWLQPLRQTSTDAWFRAFQMNHIPFDFVYTHQSFDNYDFLVYPHPAILSEETAQKLRQFVSDGGTLVFGCRAGLKDEYGRCPMRPLPGPVARLCGVEVEEYTLLGPGDPPGAVRWEDASGSPVSGNPLDTAQQEDVSGSPASVKPLGAAQREDVSGSPASVKPLGAAHWQDASGPQIAPPGAAGSYSATCSADGVIPAPLFHDVLRIMKPDGSPAGGDGQDIPSTSRMPQSAEVLARFAGGHPYDGKPALVKNRVGQGAVFYFGAAFAFETADAFVKRLSPAHPYAGLLRLPPEAELAVRRGKDCAFAFVLNFQNHFVTIETTRPLPDLLSGNVLHGAVVVEPYGVLVLRIPLSAESR